MATRGLARWSNQNWTQVCNQCRRSSQDSYWRVGPVTKAVNDWDILCEVCAEAHKVPKTDIIKVKTGTFTGVFYNQETLLAYIRTSQFPITILENLPIV